MDLLPKKESADSRTLKHKSRSKHLTDNRVLGAKVVGTGPVLVRTARINSAGWRCLRQPPTRLLFISGMTWRRSNKLIVVTPRLKSRSLRYAGEETTLSAHFYLPQNETY